MKTKHPELLRMVEETRDPARIAAFEASRRAVEAWEQARSSAGLEDAPYLHQIQALFGSRPPERRPFRGDDFRPQPARRRARRCTPAVGSPRPRLLALRASAPVAQPDRAAAF